MKIRYDLIEGLIENIFTKNPDLKSLPIDIVKVCRRLGLAYQEEALPADTSGIAISDGTTKAVVVNSGQGEKRKRFTAAHEIGHLLLHKHMSVNVDQESPVALFRDSNSAKGFDWKEMEANRFAASLLMPEDVVIGKFYGCSNGFLTEEQVIGMADDFNVSTQAMYIRLSQLGYVTY